VIFLLFICLCMVTSVSAQEAADTSVLPDVSVAVSSPDGAGGPESDRPTAVLVPAETSDAVPSPEAELVFRSLDEKKAGQSLSEASQILNSTMEVIDFRDEDLQDVLRLIAAKSRLNIIMQPDTVKGKVTLHLENVKLGVALENILKTNGLAYVVSPEE